MEVNEVKDQLLGRANVVGVGIGYKVSDGEIVLDEDGNPVECVVVSVSQKVGQAELAPGDMIPETVDSMITDVVETGPIRILSDDPVALAIDPTQRHRPVSPGMSIGLNPGVTAGTLGLIVNRSGSTQRYLLSNWHVIAADNTPVADRDVTTITQPGNHDGGQVPADVIAHLTDFEPISTGGSPIPIPSECNIASAVAGPLNLLARMFGSETRLLPVVEVDIAAEGDNLVDAAIGLLEVPSDLAIPEVGTVTGTAVPTLGMRVQKFGRTTSHTVGQITQVGATFVVQGYPGGSATFVDQVAMTADSGPFLQGGDSGSSLISTDGLAVGLCFAGSDQIGIANTWQNVEAALGVTPVLG